MGSFLPGFAYDGDLGDGLARSEGLGSNCIITWRVQGWLVFSFLLFTVHLFHLTMASGLA